MTAPSSPPNLLPGLLGRLRSLESECGDALLASLCDAMQEWMEAGVAPEWEGQALDAERLRDVLSTRLMECYRVTGSSAAFGLLYELNHRSFLAAISSRLRKFYFALDPQDVLQEVFFNIYRYPHKFQADKEKAFRYWASMIVRNTVFKSTRDKDRELSHEQQDDEIDTRPDAEQRCNPLGRVIHEESQRFCDTAYRLYLQLYLSAYQQLSTRERRALHIVEVEGRPVQGRGPGTERPPREPQDGDLPRTEEDPPLARSRDVHDGLLAPGHGRGATYRTGGNSRTGRRSPQAGLPSTRGELGTRPLPASLPPAQPEG